MFYFHKVQLVLAFITIGVTVLGRVADHDHVKWPVKSNSDEGLPDWRIHSDQPSAHSRQHKPAILNSNGPNHQGSVLVESHITGHHLPAHQELPDPHYSTHHELPDTNYPAHHESPSTHYSASASDHQNGPPKTSNSHEIHHYQQIGVQPPGTYHTKSSPSNLGPYNPAAIQPHEVHHYTAIGPYKGSSSHRHPKNAGYTQQLEDGTLMTWGPADGGTGWWNGPGSGNPEDVPPEEEEEEEAAQPAQNYKRVGRALNIASGFLIIIANIFFTSLILMAMGWSPDII